MGVEVEMGKRGSRCSSGEAVEELCLVSIIMIVCLVFLSVLAHMYSAIMFIWHWLGLEGEKGVLSSSFCQIVLWSSSGAFEDVYALFLLSHNHEKDSFNRHGKFQHIGSPIE